MWHQPQRKMMMTGPSKPIETVLFSGRFDPPHCGHIKSIQNLGKQFKHVIVVVLDDGTQTFPVSYRADILRDILHCSNGSYDVLVSPLHFGRISAVDINQFIFDVYASGNMDVIKHVEELGYPTVWVDRAYNYSATSERVANAVRKAL